MLDRDHPARREAAAIPNAVDLINDGNLGVARQKKIGVQRVREPFLIVNRTVCRNESLADDLPPKDALPPILRTAATEQVVFQLF